MISFLTENIPYIILAGGVLVYLFLQYRKNGEISLLDLKNIVEIGVKAAEYAFIKNQSVDRASLALDTIAELLGFEIDQKLMDEITTIIPAIINDLPKTSDRLDNS